jgi:hypothetical protein
MSDNFFLLVTAGFDQTQEKLLLANVKSSADSWWHEQVDIWLLKGKDAAYWANVLSHIAAIDGSRYLLLRLPPVGLRQWAGRHTRSALAWIRENYSDPEGGGAGKAPPDDPWAEAPPPVPAYSDEPPF